MFSMKGKDATSEEMAANLAAAPSIITSDVVMIGTITAKSDVQIEGRIDGDVRCVSLVIGDAGHVNGNIFAEDVTIRGHVKGSIRARRVLLCSASRVEGDLLIAALTVEVGAIFEGNCRHCDSPLAEAPNKVAEYHTALKAFASAVG